MTSATSQPALVRTAHAGASVRARTALVLAGLGAGIALAMLWSSALVDQTIGFGVADSVLGQDARHSAITTAGAGALFALVSGVAGTFTACNIAVFSALPAVISPGAGRRARLRATMGAIGCLSIGLLAVAAGYGFVAVLIGAWLPQVSTGTVAGLPVRLVQSMVVFGLIGLALLYLGLATLGRLPDPFASRPRSRLVTLGGLIAGFLVGRPYPLFHQLLTSAVASHNPWYGALALALQSLGNVLVIAVLAVLLALTGGGLASRLLSPGRAALIAGIVLVALGTFLVCYWDVRLPAAFGYGVFPTMPWNR